MEFEETYQVVHEGRARLFGLGIFGGSNGFWDVATLKVSIASGIPASSDSCLLGRLGW